MNLYDSADRGILFVGAVLVAVIIAAAMSSKGVRTAVTFLAVALVVLGALAIAGEELLFS